MVPKSTRDTALKAKLADRDLFQTDTKIRVMHYIQRSAVVNRPLQRFSTGRLRTMKSAWPVDSRVPAWIAGVQPIGVTKDREYDIMVATAGAAAVLILEMSV